MRVQETKNLIRAKGRRSLAEGSAINFMNEETDAGLYTAEILTPQSQIETIVLSKLSFLVIDGREDLRLARDCMFSWDHNLNFRISIGVVLLTCSGGELLMSRG